MRPQPQADHPLLVGAIVELRSFVIYRRNTHEQYGGYYLFQNAEFKAKKETPSLVLTAEVKYSSRKIALKTARDGEKNMTHDSVNIFFKLLLKNLL